MGGRGRHTSESAAQQVRSTHRSPRPGEPSQVPGAPGAQRPGREKTSSAPAPRGGGPRPPPAPPGGPRGGEDPGRVRRSPGSRGGAARRQGGRRGPGERRRLGGPWLRPGGRPRAAGVVAAAVAATRAPRHAAAWRGRPDPGRNRSPGAGTGPRPRRHLPARPRPGRQPRAGPPAAAAGPAAATAAPAVAAPAAPAQRRLLPAFQSPSPPSAPLPAQPASRPLPPTARLPPLRPANAHAGGDRPRSRPLAAAPSPFFRVLPRPPSLLFLFAISSPPSVSRFPLSLLALSPLSSESRLSFFYHFLFFSLLFSFFPYLQHAPNPTLSVCGARSPVPAGAVGFALLLFGRGRHSRWAPGACAPWSCATQRPSFQPCRMDFDPYQPPPAHLQGWGRLPVRTFSAGVVPHAGRLVRGTFWMFPEGFVWCRGRRRALLS